ncbi:MAG: hypothetical protein J6B53_17825 [Clostridia bacterium]|nr:hypothetical protein [Clostridia bacterium]
MRKNQGLLLAFSLMLLTQFNMPAVSKGEEPLELIEGELDEGSDQSPENESEEGGGSENEASNDGGSDGGDTNGENNGGGNDGEASGDGNGGDGNGGDTNEGGDTGGDDNGANPTVEANTGEGGAGSDTIQDTNGGDAAGGDTIQDTNGGDAAGGDSKENNGGSSSETNAVTGSDTVSNSDTSEKNKDNASDANSGEKSNNAASGNQAVTTGSVEQKIEEAGQSLQDEVEIIEGEKKAENLPKNNPEPEEIEVSMDAYWNYLDETDSFILTVTVYSENRELDLVMTRPDGEVKKLDRSDYGWSISVKAEGVYVFAVQDTNGNLLVSKKLEVKRPEVTKEKPEETDQKPAEKGNQTPVPDGTDEDDDDIVVETLTLDKQNTKKDGNEELDSSSEAKSGTDTDSANEGKGNNALLNAFNQLKSNQSTTGNEQKENPEQTEDLLTNSGGKTGNPDELSSNGQKQEKDSEPILGMDLVSELKQTEKKTEETDSAQQQDENKDELDSDGADGDGNEENQTLSQSSVLKNVQLKSAPLSLKSLNSTAPVVVKGVSGTNSENEEDTDEDSKQPEGEQNENGQNGEERENNNPNNTENGQILFKSSSVMKSLANSGEEKKNGDTDLNDSQQNENDTDKLNTANTGNTVSQLQTLNSTPQFTSLQMNSLQGNASETSQKSEVLSVTFTESEDLTETQTLNFTILYANVTGDEEENAESETVLVYYVQVDDNEPVRLDGTEYALPQEGDHTLTFFVKDAENTLAEKKITVREGKIVTEEETTEAADNEASLMMAMSPLSSTGTALTGENPVLGAELLSAAEETETIEGAGQTVQYTLSVSRTGEAEKGWSREASVFTLSHTAEPAGTEKVVYAAQRTGAEPEILDGSVYTAVDGEYMVRFLLLNEAGDELARSEAYTVKQDTVGPIMLLYITDGYGLVVTGTDTVSGAVSVSVNGGKKWSLLTQQKDGTMRRAYQANGKVTLEAGQICIRDAAGNITKSTERILLGTRDESVELETDEDKMNAKTETTTVKRSSGSGSSRSVSHAKSSTTLISAYNGVDLVLDSSAMSQLMIGEETLDLNLYPGEGNTGETAPFKARFVALNENGTLDTIVLTADESDENAYTWVFSGTVSKKLSASGIAQMVLQAGDHSITVPTDGFSGGTRYAMYRSSGKVSKDFLYALTMDTTDNTFNVNVTVDDVTYTLTDNRDSEFYYYDVRSNTAQEMSQLSEEGQS